MKISDANNIYVGSNQATAVYLGSTQIWPERTWYVDYSTMLNGGWGSHEMYSDATINLTGTYWFGAWYIDTSNLTSQYTWTTSGSITQTRIEYYDNNDPTSAVLNYQYNITGPATIILTSIITGNVAFTLTLN